MPARLSRIIAVLHEYGIEVSPPRGGGSHWKAKCDGHRSYGLPAHNGEKSIISDSYIQALCRNFDLDLDEFRAKL